LPRAGVHVELVDDEHTARARCDDLAADGAERVVLAYHQLAIGQ